jgi:hypothetical protein
VDLDWWTIDGGGTVNSTSGDLTLSGTIGQPDASGPATAGGLTLEGGFWYADSAAVSAPPQQSRIYLPLIAKDSVSVVASDLRPDLTTTISLRPAKTTFIAGEPVDVLVTVTNRGSSAASPFWVDLYVNPSEPPTAANQPWNERCKMTPCFGVAWLVSTGLAPGQSVTLLAHDARVGYSAWAGWFANGTTDLYAYADSWNTSVVSGAVEERDETNNRAELHGLQITGANPSLAALQLAEGIGQRPDPASAEPAP